MRKWLINLMGGISLERHNEILKNKQYAIAYMEAELSKVGTLVDESKIFWDYEGKEMCNEEAALAVLLADEVLGCNERHTVDIFDKNKADGPTTILYVNCNDLFYWACADGEDLTNDQIGPLYKLHKANKRWGSSKWCCLQRKLRPQVPIVKMMKDDGYWDAELEALPAPSPS